MLYLAIYFGDTELVDDLLSRTDPEGNAILTIDKIAAGSVTGANTNMFLHLLTVTDKNGSFLLTVDTLREVNAGRRLLISDPIKVALINGLCDGSISRETLSQCVVEYDANVDALLNGNSEPEDGPSLKR